ncbi:MAG: lipoyl(octanoyl) transferase LipB [Saprospiraceae bacterium]|nr:lipoyl(octanoyl) transferase LipB [Saprospiraceae bacterium]
MSGIGYAEAWEQQTAFHKQLVEQKRAKTMDNGGVQPAEIATNKLLLCEHNPVFTLGKSGSMEHLLLSEAELALRNIEFFKINRGGDITYHGPGQITGYPIFDLDQLYTDVHRYIRDMEEVIIRTIAHWGIEGHRIEGYTGVWLKPVQGGQKNRKICAIGVHLSRWVTMHGFALNVNTDLDHFKYIIPCGIEDEDKTVTSMSAETGHVIEMEDVRKVLLDEFGAVYGITWL